MHEGIQRNPDMYGLNTELDTKFFEGQRLIQVCFGKHDLILHFDETISIELLVTSSISSARLGAELRRSHDFADHASTLLACLDFLTTSVRVLDTKTLRIEFANDTDIEIPDDSEQFESFTIRYADKLIIV
jgi:hypothetical protein